MCAKDATHEYRLAQWVPIIKECRNSDLSVKHWCQQNNVNEKRFYFLGLISVENKGNWMQ
ncbi:MAG: hypothetical protein AB9856_15245 [Cellulosilyticaceae bacterium]